MLNAGILGALFGEDGIIGWWQILGIIVLIGIIIFYVQYRKKQM